MCNCSTAHQNYLRMVNKFSMLKVRNLILKVNIMSNLKISCQVFFYVAILQLFLSCKKSNVKEDSQNSQIKNIECYYIFNSIDSSPIAGASVTMEHLVNGLYLPFDGLTDSSGHICNEYASDLPAAEQLLVSKTGYLPKCPGTGVQSTVFLTPNAFVKLHLKNIIPANSGDEFSLTYPAGYCSSTWVLYLTGANVDSNLVLPVWTGTKSVSWVLNNGISHDSIMIFTSRDTVYYEILY